jgi:hypothetical protein
MDKHLTRRGMGLIFGGLGIASARAQTRKPGTAIHQEVDFKAAPQRMPTVVNGNAYIPTSGISYYVPDGSTSSLCSLDSPCSGLVVYCYQTTTACNGSWQQ